MFKRLESIWGSPERLDALEEYLLQAAPEKFVRSMQEANDKAHEELLKRIQNLEALVASPSSPVFQSGKSHLASDEIPEEEVPEDAEADYIKLGGKAISHFMGLMERSYEGKQLAKAQRRFINRLLRLLRITVEDPGRSITEDLRKAERWNKVLRKKVKGFVSKDCEGLTADINLKGE